MLAEPGRPTAAPLPGRGINDLQVRVAHDPVQAEVGRLSRLPGLRITHSCQERNREQPSINSPAPNRAPVRADNGKKPCV